MVPMVPYCRFAHNVTLHLHRLGLYEAPLFYIRLLKFNMEHHASVGMIFLEKTGKGETSILFRNAPFSDSILNFDGCIVASKKLLTSYRFFANSDTKSSTRMA